MNKLSCIVFIYFSLSVPCYADPDNTESITPEQQPEYLSPSEITQDDYARMQDHTIRYNDCIDEKSQTELNNYNDPRHVVDAAMKLCAYELEELNQWMTERGFSPPSRQRYIRRLSSRAVGNTMRSVMITKASQQSATE